MTVATIVPRAMFSTRRTRRDRPKARAAPNTVMRNGGRVTRLDPERVSDPEPGFSMPGHAAACHGPRSPLAGCRAVLRRLVQRPGVRLVVDGLRLVRRESEEPLKKRSFGSQRAAVCRSLVADARGVDELVDEDE